MKYVYLCLSVLCLIATITFIIREDTSALLFSVGGMLLNLINFYLGEKSND